MLRSTRLILPSDLNNYLQCELVVFVFALAGEVLVWLGNKGGLVDHMDLPSMSFDLNEFVRERSHITSQCFLNS